MTTLNTAWKNQLTAVMANGHAVSPRGMLTKELPQRTLVFDMLYPVITIPERKLGYKFLAAEAWWILSGKNDVASIAPYSREISRFSDDGETFFGSYGPPFVEQLAYVVWKLSTDPDTRQATMTFWRQNPPETKDVPCTVAIDFKLRHGKLNTHVFMRSSDNWLGIPYDAFNFTMMTCRVLELLNEGRKYADQLSPGTQYLTAASSHLYERNFPQAMAIIRDEAVVPTPLPMPEHLYGRAAGHSPIGLIQKLEILKDNSRYKWWEEPSSCTCLGMPGGDGDCKVHNG